MGSAPSQSSARRLRHDTRSMTTRRLNWGCGRFALRGWINADIRPGPGVDVLHDIREGLPIRDATCSYAVSIHGLQDLSYLDVLPALRELRRALEPGGVLRIAVPDLDRALSAYLAGDRQYFYVPDDDAKSIGGKLVAQIVWYGSVRTPFTWDAMEELVLRAGFTAVWRASFGMTATAHPEIVALDNRRRESLFVEAVR